MAWRDAESWAARLHSIQSRPHTALHRWQTANGGIFSNVWVERVRNRRGRRDSYSYNLRRLGKVLKARYAKTPGVRTLPWWGYVLRTWNWVTPPGSPVHLCLAERALPSRPAQVAGSGFGWTCSSAGKNPQGRPSPGIDGKDESRRFGQSLSRLANAEIWKQ